MGADGGLMFIDVHPTATVEEAYQHLSLFFNFDCSGCPWGDDSRSDWLVQNDSGHCVVSPYGTDLGDHDLMIDEVMDFLEFLEDAPKKLGIEEPTFGDVLMDLETQPSWYPVDSKQTKRIYRAIKEATDTHSTLISEWIAGLKKVLKFTKSYRGTYEVRVDYVETWT